ncbi:MAG: mismatch-specific DNA-glycosylase [Alphaproteobacteria bacterium]
MLAPGLRVVFCGSAVGAVSAKVGAPYAGPGNKFWPMLHKTGLTPRLMRPDEYLELPGFGIGLTDLAKHYSGADAGLRPEDDDVDALIAKVERFRPRLLAFNGKRAASKVLGKCDYGEQPDRLAGARVFVLPSTSGLAVRFWDEAPWFALAQAALGAAAFTGSST